MAKILLVEDDNNLREIYEARLQAEGYDIMSAQDGEEALVIAKKNRPDVIISDVMMPRVSGFEMLDILRNTEGLKDVKVVMLTALGQAEDRSRAGSLGADRYLVKSQVTLEDIVKAAQELLATESKTNTAATPESAAPSTPTLEPTVLATPEPQPTPETKPEDKKPDQPPVPAPAPALTPPAPTTPPIRPTFSAPTPPTPPPALPVPVVPPGAPTPPPKPSTLPPTPAKSAVTPAPAATPTPPIKIPVTSPPPAPRQSSVISAAMTEKDKKTAAAGLTLPGVANEAPGAHALTPEAETRAQIASFLSLNDLTAPKDDDESEKPASAPKPVTAPTPPAPVPPTVTPPAAKPTPTPPATPKPAAPTPVKIEVKPQPTGMTQAIDSLMQDANKQADSSGPAAFSDEKEPTIASKPAPAAPPTTEKPNDKKAEPTKQPETTPDTKKDESSSEEGEDNDAVTVAHKKVISPLSDSFATDDATDLNELLAKEGHDMSSDDAEDDTQNPTDMPHFVAAAHPPGHIFSPSSDKDKE